MEKAFSWLSPHSDQYDTLNTHKCCFQLSRVFMIEKQYTICQSEKKITIQILYLGYSVQRITEKCPLTLCIMEKTWEVTLQNWDRSGQQQIVIIQCQYQTQGFFPVSLQGEHACWNLCSIAFWNAGEFAPSLNIFSWHYMHSIEGVVFTQYSWELVANGSWAYMP